MANANFTKKALEICKKMRENGRKNYPENNLKVMIVGTFGSGKSSLINLLLRDEIMRVRAVYHNFVLTEVKYGALKHGRLHFCHALPDELPEGIPYPIADHISKYGKYDLPPVDIPLLEIEEYICKTFSPPISISPYSQELYKKLELFVPHELLKNGIEIVRYPDLGYDSHIFFNAADDLAKADVILFILRIDAICSHVEMNFIEELYDRGLKDRIFFIVNRSDLIAPDEKADIHKYIDIKLSRYSGNCIRYLSAKTAQDGITENDLWKFESSGIRQVEADLYGFLAAKKYSGSNSAPV